MLQRCNSEPTLGSFSGEETETHCSPPQKVSKPGLDRAGSLVQPKPGRLFGRPVHTYKGRKIRRRYVSTNSIKRTLEKLISDGKRRLEN